MGLGWFYVGKSSYILGSHDPTSETLIPDFGTSIDSAFPILESCTV